MRTRLKQQQQQKPTGMIKEQKTIKIDKAGF
jgi:hypothetical protein